MSRIHLQSSIARRGDPSEVSVNWTDCPLTGLVGENEKRAVKGSAAFYRHPNGKGVVRLRLGNLIFTICHKLYDTMCKAFRTT